MKKLALIFGLVAIIALPALQADASAVFNNASNDKPTLKISNYSVNPNCSTCWSSFVSADAGQIVSFQIYYHNNSNETAHNTRLRFNLPSGNFTNQTITGEVFADNAPSAMGSVAVNLSSSQNLSFIQGSARWYPDRATDSANPVFQPLPFGQNGSEVISSSGLNIGDINPGWATAGVLIFRAQVSGSNQQTGNAPIVNTNSASNIGQNSATLNGSVNPNGSNTTAWFEYGTTQSLGTTVGNQSIGSANSNQNIIAYLSNLQQNTTYYFRAVAQNSFGTTYGTVMSFATNYQQQYGSAPIVNTNMAYSITQNSATLSGSVNPNNSYTNVWFEYGTNYALNYGQVGYQSVGSGNYNNNITAYLSNLQSNTTYYFRIAAQNAYGTNYGAMLSFSTIGGYYNNYPQQNAGPIVNTLQATYVYQNSALINGSVNPNGSLTTAWFEWGRYNNLGNRSDSRAVGSGYNSFNFNSVLSGLDEGVTYYYRAAAQNTYGTNYGNTVAIKTQSAYTPVQPQQKIVTQTVAVKSKVNLELDLDNEEINAGETITLSATFRNDNSYAISNAVLKIVLPAEVKYSSASHRPSNRENSTLTFNLGAVKANTQGVIDVTVKVNSDVKENSILIFGGTLDYTDKNTGFESIETFITAQVIEGVTGEFTASLFNALRGIFTSPWFYILLLLLAVGLSSWYFGKRSVMKTTL